MLDKVPGGTNALLLTDSSGIERGSVEEFLRFRVSDG